MIWNIQIMTEKIFLSRTNKHNFHSENFSNLLVCKQYPKQLKTWDGCLA